MPESDGVRLLIQIALETAQQASIYGTFTTEAATDVITSLQNARESMDASRNRAMQALEQMVILVAQNNQLSAESMSIESITAGVDFSIAKQKMEDYANRMYLAMQKMDRLIAVIAELRVEGELFESGKALKAGVKHLENYRDIL